MKALSISLNTDQISRIGFSRILQQQIDNLRKSGFYSIAFHEEGETFRLSPHKEIILLRMCQVILDNIVKHAEAKSIHIRLIYEASTLKVEIIDDGKGFDVESIANHPQKQDSSGLRNLHKRALALNAELTIKSQPGQGTHILISTPI